MTAYHVTGSKPMSSAMYDTLDCWKDCTSKGLLHDQTSTAILADIGQTMSAAILLIGTWPGAAAGQH